MKKFIAMILAIAVLIPACGAIGESEAPAAAEETVQEEQHANAFDAYDQEGYTHGNISISGDNSGMVLQVYFNSADKTDCVLVEAALTDEENAAMEALDFFDDNYWTNQWNILTGISSDRITVTGLNDRIPSEEAVSQYVGRTVEDLMNDGYEWSTDTEDDAGNDIMIFQNYDTCIMYAVTLAGNPDIEDLSDEKIGSQVVESIRFWGFDC